MSSHGHKDPPKPVNSDHGYETTDAAAKPLLVFAGILAVFTIACFIGGFVTYRVLEHLRTAVDPISHPMSSERQMPEGMPKLQIIEAKDLTAFRKSESEILTSYGWISREAGKVRVPVDKAIELVLKKGQLKTRE